VENPYQCGTIQCMPHKSERSTVRASLPIHRRPSWSRRGGCGASSFQVCPFFSSSASCPSFSASCLPQHRVLHLELMSFLKIEFRNSICVEKNGNKWRWALRLPPKTLASSHEGVVASPGSSGSEGARVYVPPYIVRTPS
jgi:hypothetical protein